MLFTDKDPEHHRLQGTCPESLSWCKTQAMDPPLTSKSLELLKFQSRPERWALPRPHGSLGQCKNQTWVFSLLTRACCASPLLSVLQSLRFQEPLGEARSFPTSPLIPNTTSQLRGKERGGRHAHPSAPLFIQPRTYMHEISYKDTLHISGNVANIL